MSNSSIREIRDRFTRAGLSSVDVELLIAHVLGVSRMQLHAQQYQLTSDALEELADLAARRSNGEPLQYLTGLAPFRYLEFEVGPGVLIPRPETESLVDAVMVEIERIQSAPTWRSGECTSIVDIGAGSGAIGISIAHESRRRGLKVSTIAVEIEADAIKWLRRNIARHDVEVRVIAEDVASALPGIRSDIVVANPPYIPNSSKLPIEVEEFEPARALYGGDLGSEAPKNFIYAAARILKSGGFLAIEHHESQGEELAEFMISDYVEIAQFEDLNQRPRWITARRKG